MRTFGQAPQTDEEYVEEREVAEEIVVAGKSVTLYVPTIGQASYLAMAVAKFEQGDELVSLGNIINLIGNSMDEEGQKHWSKVLVDPRYKISADEIMSLAMSLIEEGSGNPTPEPSGSSPSRSATGARSTAGSRRAPSTQKRSRSTGS